MTRVADHMTHNPLCVQSDASLSDILHKMDNSKLSHLLVIDDKKSLKGVISKADLLKKTRYIMRATTGKTYSAIKEKTILAKEIMTDDVKSVQADDSAEKAISLLLENDFHCLPVLRGENLVGIITYYDLLKNLIK